MSSASPLENSLTCFRPLLQPDSSIDACVIKTVTAYATHMEHYKDLPKEIERAAISRQVKLNDQCSSIQLLHGDSYLKITHQKAQTACEKIKETIDSLKEIIAKYYPYNYWNPEDNHQAHLETYQGELTDLLTKIRDAAASHKIEPASQDITDRVRIYVISMLPRSAASTEANTQPSENPDEQASYVIVDDKEKESDS